MPFSPLPPERSMARSSVRTISVVNSLVSSGTIAPEMEGERLFAWAVPSKRRYFRKAVCTASVSSSPLSVPGQASAADRPFSRAPAQAALSPSTASSGRIEARIPAGFSPSIPVGKLVFRQKRQRHARLPQFFQRRALRQLFFVDSISNASHARSSYMVDERHPPTRQTAFGRSSPNHLCTRPITQFM